VCELLSDTESLVLNRLVGPINLTHKRIATSVIVILDRPPGAPLPKKK